jgi:hypothetical protein
MRTKSAASTRLGRGRSVADSDGRLTEVRPQPREDKRFDYGRAG